MRATACACALLLASAHAAVVQELKFVADAKQLEAAAGGVVVVGLFGAGDGAEKRGFMHAAKSAEFQDEGWAVTWSGEPKIVDYFGFSTPSMVVYRVFDVNGTRCAPTPERYNATMGGGWTYRGLKSFIFAVSFPPVSLFPVPPPPEALAEPLDDAEVDEDAYDDLEERRVAELKAFLVLRTAENQRLTAALKQTTVPKLVVYMHDERYFDVHEDERAALLSFAKHSLGRVVVVKMTLDDNPLAEPIAAMGGFTMDEIREGAGGLRPTGIFLGSEGTMPFDGLYVEEALHWALNDFFEQGAGGSDAKWEPKPKKKKRKKKRAAELR